MEPSTNPSIDMTRIDLHAAIAALPLSVIIQNGVAITKLGNGLAVRLPEGYVPTERSENFARHQVIEAIGVLTGKPAASESEAIRNLHRAMNSCMREYSIPSLHAC